MKKKYFLSLMTFMMVSMLSVGFVSCGDDGGGVSYADLEGIWVHSDKYGYDYVMVFKGNKVFEEEMWEYTNKNSVLQRYNNESYWRDYSISGNTLIVDDFSTNINVDGDTFSFTDGDGKSQTFTRWNGTIESFLNEAIK